MELYDLIITRRSVRQFKDISIPIEALNRIVNAARLAPTAANLQPLEFFVVDKAEIRENIFPCLKWAGYIEPEGNPRKGNEPTAYIFILVNSKIRDEGYEYDAGAALENMCLTAWEAGIGSCCLISIDKDKVRQILEIPDDYIIDSVVALGYPAEESKVEPWKGSVEYWKDKEGLFHVPKRKLEDIIHFNKF